MFKHNIQGVKEPQNSWQTRSKLADQSRPSVNRVATERKKCRKFKTIIEEIEDSIYNRCAESREKGALKLSLGEIPSRLFCAHTYIGR